MATRPTGDRRWGCRLLALAVTTAVAGTAAVAYLAGRGQDDPNESRERSPERALAALAGLDEDVLLDPAVLDDPHALSDRFQLDVEEAVAQCMADAGFPYQPVPEDGNSGPTPASQANYDYWATLPPEEERRYDDGHQRCDREAYESVVVPAAEALSRLFPKVRDEYAAILGDTSVAPSVDEWTECMASDLLLAFVGGR